MFLKLMQAHLFFYHFATEKSINSLKAPNQTLETGQIGYVNTPHLTGNAQCTGQIDGNGKNGKETSLHLLDDQNGEDQYEALESLSVGTERGVFNTSCERVSAAPVDAVLAEEDQYETLDAVFAQKACHESNDGKGAKMFGDKKANERVLKRDENFEEEVALDENLEDKLFGNDDKGTSSALVYEEAIPDSHGLGCHKQKAKVAGKTNTRTERLTSDKLPFLTSTTLLGLRKGTTSAFMRRVCTSTMKSLMAMVVRRNKLTPQTVFTLIWPQHRQ